MNYELWLGYLEEQEKIQKRYDDYAKEAKLKWKEFIQDVCGKEVPHRFLQEFQLNFITEMGIMGNYKGKNYAIVRHVEYRDIDGENGFSYYWRYKKSVMDKKWKDISNMKQPSENYEKTNQIQQVLEKIVPFMCEIAIIESKIK